MKNIIVISDTHGSIPDNEILWEAFDNADYIFHLGDGKNEIAKLKEATGRSRQWADKNESTKIGYDPVKEPGRANRAYIGEKTRKMQSRVKQMEKRIEREIEEKEGLLQDVENPVDLKIMPLAHFKETLLYVNHYGLSYQGMDQPLFQDLNFTLRQGERVFLAGANGCGKSSLFRAILQKNGMEKTQENLTEDGTLQMA